MKNKSFLSLLMIIFCVISIVGCSQKKPKVKVEHQQLTWHEAREKPFGMFDYPKVTEKEGLDLLKNKFNVKVPKLIQQVKELLKDEVAVEGMLLGDPEYTLYATGDELKARAYYSLNEGTELIVFVLVDLKYTFNKEKKEARLLSQSLSMTTYGEKTTYPKDNFEELLASSGKIIDLPTKLADRSIQNFIVDNEKVDKRPTASKSIVYSNDKEAVEKKLVSQTLLGGFDSQRELKEIYAMVVDYTE